MSDLEAAYIGLDVGTTGVRGLLVREEGSVASVEESHHDTVLQKVGWAEQDPDDWAKGSLSVLTRLARTAHDMGLHVEALGLTGQMHGATFVGLDDKPVRPAIIWMDQRSIAEADELQARLEQSGLETRSLNRSLPNMTASKVLWLERHEPEHRRVLRTLLLPKDYVRLVLTGEKATDVSDASGTLLLDIGQRVWSGELAGLVGLTLDQLPRVAESNAITGRILRSVADATGLPPDTPVVAGAGDQAAGAIGVGVRAVGDVMISLGTSGVVFGAVATPPRPRNPSLHAFCHAVDNTWHWMGVTQAAGGSLKWLRQTMLPGLSYSELDRRASDVAPGSEGLFFLPYLMGERAPILDPEARGALAGITARHGIGHLARAVMEGVAYSLRSVLDAAQADFRTDGSVRITGGGATSPLWRSILSAVLDRQLETVSSPQGAAFGAALLAAEGTSNRPDPSGTWIQVHSDRPPDRTWIREYRTGMSRYLALYPALQPLTRPE